MAWMNTGLWFVHHHNFKSNFQFTIKVDLFLKDFFLLLATVADTMILQSSWMQMATRFMEWIGLVSPRKIFMCSPLSFTFQLSQRFLYVCAWTCYLDSLTIDNLLLLQFHFNLTSKLLCSILFMAIYYQIRDYIIL